MHPSERVLEVLDDERKLGLRREPVVDRNNHVARVDHHGFEEARALATAGYERAAMNPDDDRANHIVVEALDFRFDLQVSDRLVRIGLLSNRAQ